MSLVLLLLSFRKLDDIQIFIACRQFTSDCGGSWVDGLVLRYSCVSSANE